MFDKNSILQRIPNGGETLGYVAIASFEPIMLCESIFGKPCARIPIFH